MENIIEKLATGDILHCTGKRLISKLIRKFTKSRFSHTAIFIELWGQPYVIDAQKDGVNVRPWSEWRKEYDYKFIASRPPACNEKEFAIKAMSKVGFTAYDLEGLLIRQPWELLTGKWRNRGNKEDDVMYCSEYAAWCHNFPEFYRMSPEDVWNYCEANNWQIVLTVE